MLYYWWTFEFYLNEIWIFSLRVFQFNICLKLLDFFIFAGWSGISFFLYNDDNKKTRTYKLKNTQRQIPNN